MANKRVAVGIVELYLDWFVSTLELLSLSRVASRAQRWMVNEEMAMEKKECCLLQVHLKLIASLHYRAS